jgi:hypothetical protein
MTFRSVVLLVGLAALSLGASPAGAETASLPVVDAAVQVTNDARTVRGHAGPALAVHPDDDSVIALGEAEARTGRCGLHLSKNAGLTWSEEASPQPEAWPRCTWANYGRVVDISFAEDGTLYYGLTGMKQGENVPAKIFSARSADLGRSFETVMPPGLEPDLAENNAGIHGEPTVRADPNNPDRVYMAWQTNWGMWNLDENQLPKPGRTELRPFRSRPLLAVSDDGGKTFAAPINFAGDAGDHLNETDLIVGNEGELFAFLGESAGPEEESATTGPGASLWFITSNDGGKTFQQEAIHTLPQSTAEGEEEPFSWLGRPVASIDRQSGDLYVVWENGGGDTASVQFMRSTDNGKTWSEPVQVNAVEHPRDNLYNEIYPTVDVAPNGRIDVAWYDWRNDYTYSADASTDSADASKGGLQDIYYRYSSDGGVTWAQSMKLNDRAIDRRFGVFGEQDVNGPVALVSRDEVTYAAWDDTRNGNPENAASDIYFTRVRFGEPSAVFDVSGAGSSPRLWALTGLAGGLTLAGLALLLGGPLVRRRRGGREAATSSQ